MTGIGSWPTRKAPVSVCYRGTRRTGPARTAAWRRRCGPCHPAHCSLMGRSSRSTDGASPGFSYCSRDRHAPRTPSLTVCTRTGEISAGSRWSRAGVHWRVLSEVEPRCAWPGALPATAWRRTVSPSGEALKGSSPRIWGPPTSRRSGKWLKVKVRQEEEFVIAGYTAPRGARTRFGALLLGAHDRQGNLRYVGKVGTGFTEQSLDSLYRKSQPLVRVTSPFADPPRERGATHLSPRLVAQVAFEEWTADLKLRQPAFLGLSDDKKPEEITLPEAAP